MAEITEEQLKLMKHMLGLDYKKKPYRNYGYFYKEQQDLEDLVNKGYALKKSGDKEGHFVYHLNIKGVEYALGREITEKEYAIL